MFHSLKFHRIEKTDVQLKFCKQILSFTFLLILNSYQVICCLFTNESFYNGEKSHFLNCNTCVSRPQSGIRCSSSTFIGLSVQSNHLEQITNCLAGQLNVQMCNAHCAQVLLIHFSFEKSRFKCKTNLFSWMLFSRYATAQLNMLT